MTPISEDIIFILRLTERGNLGRPIVSANDHPVETSSAFTDYHLSLHVKSLPSYLKRTPDYLHYITKADPLPENAILISLDVTYL